VGGANGEFQAIERIRLKLEERLGPPPPGEVWIGDDAAVLAAESGCILLATDAVVEGVHGDPAVMGLDGLGWRALVSSLSDIAAMGGAPRNAVVAVTGPPDTDLDRLYEGVAEAAEEHGCRVVGGDLSQASQLVVVATVTGTVDAYPGPVLRSGARGGHALLVSGPLGASAAGLRVLRRSVAPDDEGAALARSHLRPRAHVAAGSVARRAGASAMIDVSDGLSADLAHLADASGVGFELENVPVARGATLEDALGGGEDYELVMAAPDPGRVVEAFTSSGLPPPLLIGSCTENPSRRTVHGEPLAVVGFEHHFGGGRAPR
jgi:thiamine-monophosphate kinase